MATVLKRSTFDGTNGSHFFIELQSDLLNQDKVNNTTKIKYYLYVGSTDGYDGSGTAFSCYINDQNVGSVSSIGKNSYSLVGTLEDTITHDEEGKAKANYSASASGVWTGLGSASLSGEYPLPTIPRNFTQQPKITVEKATTTSIVIKWETSEVCSDVKYYLDGSSTGIDVFDGNSTNGTFTIANLKPNSNHVVYVECKRLDSGLSSNSESLTCLTSDKTVRIKINEEWKQATPYLKVNGLWKKVVAFKKIDGVWKGGV